MSDLIRRSDAIEAVWLLEKEASEYVVDDSKEIHGYCTAIGVCVGELSALPSAEAEDRHYIKIYADDEPSVKAEKLYQICGETQNREVTEWLKEYFPSAEPKTGEWIKAKGMMPPEFHGHHCCSECGNFANMEPPFGNREDLSRYCPNCGAKMCKGGEEE